MKMPEAANNSSNPIRGRAIRRQSVPRDWKPKGGPSPGAPGNPITPEDMALARAQVEAEEREKYGNLKVPTVFPVDEKAYDLD